MTNDWPGKPAWFDEFRRGEAGSVDDLRVSWWANLRVKGMLSDDERTRLLWQHGVSPERWGEAYGRCLQQKFIRIALLTIIVVSIGMAVLFGVTR